MGVAWWACPGRGLEGRGRIQAGGRISPLGAAYALFSQGKASTLGFPSPHTGVGVLTRSTSSGAGTGTEAGSTSRGLQGLGTGSYPPKNTFQGLACPEPGRFPDLTF